MKDRYLITPYFLDESLPGLEGLYKKGDYLNKPEMLAGDVQSRMSVLHEALAVQVDQILRAGDRPVSLAGDCCTALGVTAGLQRAGFEYQIIWFDAHGDFNTWETSPSGFLGGMPLAMLVGRGEQTMLEAISMQPHPEQRVVITDGRDLDPLEEQALAGSEVTHLAQVSDLLHYELPDLPVHIHFDTDVLSPETAPAMNYLAPGGPNLAELKRIFIHLVNTLRIVAVSLSSWNPALDARGETQNACMEALEALLEA